eukprot:TRINITY_DN50039_c0_g1_i1.p1 TRINITY_DN50039_c0_g1~~TRINITY_DN50039_c0_g1_i1.p1  ORF type:complete len:131 (-),score=22.50 TRINITY_DN50039_c0_g1_i1:50-442(-)
MMVCLYWFSKFMMTMLTHLPVLFFFFFFFFKQKTAYEMLRSLVGSEMCIRDSCYLGASCRLWCSEGQGVEPVGIPSPPPGHPAPVREAGGVAWPQSMLEEMDKELRRQPKRPNDSSSQVEHVIPELGSCS